MEDILLLIAIINMWSALMGLFAAMLKIWLETKGN